MALYENTFIIRQDLSEQAVEAITDQLADIITAKGGKIVKREYWGLRELAYKINKAGRGHYAFFGIEANDNEVLEELNKRVALSEDVVRHLNVKVKELSNEQSPVIAEKEGEE